MKILKVLSEAAGGSASIALLFIVLLVVVDVTLRRFFDHPLAFSYELTSLSLVVLVWASIFFSTHRDMHITVDILFSRFPRKKQVALDCIFAISSSLLLFLMAVDAFLYAIREFRMKHVSEILDIPFYPFVLVCSGFSFLCGLAFLVRGWKWRPS